VANHDFWVFGYGSLMWDPGFPHREARTALVRGYHREFIVYSYRAWGSPDKPGLVASLAPGGSCRGRAYRVAAAARGRVLDYLDRREQAYERRQVRLELDHGVIGALAYVATPDHPRFAGRLAPERAARLIHQGVGEKGSSRAYLTNTVRYLDDVGIGDSALHALLALVEALDER
jgi:cation transport protein ChaC